MPALGEYVNVYNTALKVLQDKGFQLWYDESCSMYCGERSGWDFMAENPISLLGLVAIYESQTPEKYTEYWWRAETKLHYRNLPRKPRPYQAAISIKSP